MKRGNFRCIGNSIGVEAQLGNLASITQVIDPKLHQHLGKSYKLLVWFVFAPFLLRLLQHEAKYHSLLLVRCYTKCKTFFFPSSILVNFWEVITNIPFFTYRSVVCFFFSLLLLIWVLLCTITDDLAISKKRRNKKNAHHRPLEMQMEAF